MQRHLLDQAAEGRARWELVDLSVRVRPLVDQRRAQAQLFGERVQHAVLVQPAVGANHGELTLNTSAPVEAVHVVAGPSRPQGAAREGALAWRLLSLLSLNYLSLLDESPEQGALALREILGLFAHSAEAGLKRQIEGVRSVTVRPVVRRHLERHEAQAIEPVHRGQPRCDPCAQTTVGVVEDGQPHRTLTGGGG